MSVGESVMNRIRNVQILFLLGAAALLSACTSVTTTVPSGRAPAFEARADQVVVIDPADRCLLLIGPQ